VTRLGEDFFARPVVEVARDLVGCVLRHGDAAGVIVETEAYHDTEAACHAHIGMTARTSILFGPPGRAYVYRSYGIHALFNAVCEPEGVGAAVLVRALEPLDGVDLMHERRQVPRELDLCSGPGKLSQALGIELTENGTSLTAGPIAIEAGPPPSQLLEGTRIGITKAADLPWRFCAPSRHVSRPWPPGLRGAL
jgi:DNA-3-methyladenine glycosylase